MRSIFDLASRSLLKATYWRADRDSPLGVTTKDKQDLVVLWDRGSEVNLATDLTTQTDDVLIYGMPGSALATSSVKGGYIQVFDGHSNPTFLITEWNVAENQKLGVVDHYEVLGQETNGVDA